MSYQPPLPPGSGPYNPYGPPPQGGPYSHGGHPAYAGYPSPAPQSNGLNPWLAGFIGTIIGGVGAMALSFLVPILFFGLAMGATGGFGDEGFLEGPPSRVAVEPDGSVRGAVLADVLSEGGWYDDLTCPDTDRVATDVTTICRGSDGIDALRVVVVFRGTDGRFDTAELFGGPPLGG